MSVFEDFNEIEFTNKVDASLLQVKKLLSLNKTIGLIGDTSHSYQDKFIVTNNVTNAMLSSCLLLFEELGFTSESIQALCLQAQASHVSLRFESKETCVFVEETTKSVENPHSTQTTTGMLSSVTKSYTKVTEYTYKFNVTYILSAYRGVGATVDDIMQISSRSASQLIVLRAKTAVYPEQDIKRFEVNITWLLQKINPIDGTGTFEINRSQDKCFTPRRNPDIDAALVFCAELTYWAESVKLYFRKLFDVQLVYSQNHVRPNLALMEGWQMFNPVFPLMDSTDEFAVAVSPSELAAMLNEHKAGLLAKRAELQAAFAAPSPSVILTAFEAVFFVSLVTIQRTIQNFADSVNYIEAVIMRQLIAAVGKVLPPAEFDAYMHFHYRRLFNEDFLPRALSTAVRRSSEHSPEGIVRIEEAVEGKVSQPVFTFSKSQFESVSPMAFPLSSSSKVMFTGERHVHLYLAHSFSGDSPSQLKLVAQARQFSSFILIVGRVASAKEFDPKYAIIVQNKDEIKIPLNLEQIPTAKEFRNAIQSLSPEQQRFASAIRSMQLGGTVFGFVVIQIKPQMEKLLKLHPDSLTKEIALGQDLMEIFLKYQIPSDLVSFEGLEDIDGPSRVTQVKRHVEAIKAMVLKAKEEEGREKELHDKAVFGGSPQVFSLASAPLPPPATSSFGFGSPPVLPSASSSFGFSRRLASMPMSKKGDMAREEMMTPLSASGLDNCAPRSAYVSDEVEYEEEIQECGESAPLEAGSVVAPIARKDPSEIVDATASSGTLDYTSLPSLLDKAHDKLDPDSALRATLINPSETWEKSSQKGLLRGPSSTTLRTKDLEHERCAAFDLLDALSRSGASVLEDAALHIVIASTHNFDMSLMDTVVKGNVNPIERVERSALILASTLHGAPTEGLIKQDQAVRVQSFSPSLFIAE